MGYKCVYMLSEIQEYLKNTVLFAFDFETSPCDKWRNDKSAALDAHKADITGISFSVSEGTAIYVPLKHRSGRNAENQSAKDFLPQSDDRIPSKYLRLPSHVSE
jgi:DNA polymerase-1